MLPDTTACTILLVDDEEANLDLLEALLRRHGYRSIVRTDDASRAVPLWEACRPDLVLLDLHMPHLSGFDVLRELQARTPPDEYRPVLVLTADATLAARQRALAGGANDFVTKPFNNAEVVLRVGNLLRTRLLHREQRRAREGAELLAEAGRVLNSSFDTATTVGQLARLVVPRLAEVCVVELFDNGLPVHTVAARAEGEGALLYAAPAERPALGGETERPGALFGDPPPASVAVIPLVLGGAPAGRLALGWRQAGREMRAEEQALLAELAHRAALAVENARLFQHARAATEARERVLAVVAHDLRGPLCAVRLDAEMLREALPAGARRETQTLRRVERAVARMDELIQDLLDVSRLDRHGLSLCPAPLDMAALLAEAGDALHPLMAAHGLRFEVVAPPDVPPVSGDAARLLQVISNLAGNAAKFTPVGGSVTLSCAPGDGEVRVSVADTGPGIPPEQIPHLFGAFWQARYADRRGLGLGLSIARGIVEAHGGRIWVESEVGRGTTFVFSLPTSDPSPDAP